MDLTLHDWELADLTGHHKMEGQVAWLRAQKVPFAIGPKGSVLVLRRHTEDWLDGERVTTPYSRNLERIRKGQFGVEFSHKESGVYLLRKCGEVVYVGRSENLFSRIARHQDDKDFDTIQFVRMPKSRQAAYEAELIKSLKPKYNVLGV